MKKMLLLSVVCVNFLAQAEDDFFDPNDSDMLKNLGYYLKTMELDDIKNDVNKMIDPTTSKLKSIDEANQLNLTTRNVGLGCQSVLESLVRGINKDQLQPYAQKCETFYRKIVEVLDQAPLDQEQKHEYIAVLKDLMHIANELAK